MDPITTTIVATLPALASDLVKSSLKDAYEGLKSVIRRTWGGNKPRCKIGGRSGGEPEIKGSGRRPRRKCRGGPRPLPMLR